MAGGEPPLWVIISVPKPKPHRGEGLQRESPSFAHCGWRGEGTGERQRRHCPLPLGTFWASQTNPRPKKPPRSKSNADAPCQKLGPGQKPGLILRHCRKIILLPPTPMGMDDPLYKQPCNKNAISATSSSCKRLPLTPLLSCCNRQWTVLNHCRLICSLHYSPNTT